MYQMNVGNDKSVSKYKNRKNSKIFIPYLLPHIVNRSLENFLRKQFVYDLPSLQVVTVPFFGDVGPYTSDPSPMTGVNPIVTFYD